MKARRELVKGQKTHSHFFHTLKRFKSLHGLRPGQRKAAQQAATGRHGAMFCRCGIARVSELDQRTSAVLDLCIRDPRALSLIGRTA